MSSDSIIRIPSYVYLLKTTQICINSCIGDDHRG